MSLKEALDEKLNPEHRKKMFRTMLDFHDVMEKMKPGTRKEDIKRMWEELYGGINRLDNSDWWIEAERTGGDMKDEFLRDREGK